MVYFVEEGCFPEQDEFIELAQRTYGFELQRVGQHMKENTAMLVRDHGVRAFLMGTRRADPYAATLDNFSPSTDGWAPFMRVNPVLEWEYDMVWQFIRDFSIPYCSLYDKGYSSVGLMNNTERNQNLVRPDGTYRPAWELDRLVLVLHMLLLSRFIFLSQTLSGACVVWAEPDAIAADW